MSRTLACYVADNAHRGSNAGRDPVSVGLLDQYLLSKWPDSQSFSLIDPGSGNIHVLRWTRVRTRERAYSARWNHIGSRRSVLMLTSVYTMPPCRQR